MKRGGLIETCPPEISKFKSKNSAHFRDLAVHDWSFLHYQLFIILKFVFDLSRFLCIKRGSEALTAAVLQAGEDLYFALIQPACSLLSYGLEDGFKVDSSPDVAKETHCSHGHIYDQRPQAVNHH